MYFILLYNTLAGAQSVDPDHLQLARSLGLPRRQVFLRVVIPTAIPSIFVGLRLGLVYTLLGVVTAELIAGGKGLGSLISYYSNTFNADGVSRCAAGSDRPRRRTVDDHDPASNDGSRAGTGRIR